MSKKPQITFETESDLHDAIKATIKSINDDSSKLESIQPYLSSLTQVQEFYEDTYMKNVHLLEALQEMNAQIVVIASKIQMIHNSTTDDRDSLSKLKEEFDEASRMVLFANKSEKRSKEVLANLRSTIQVLSDKIMRSETFTMGEDVSAFEIQSDVANLTRERDDADVDINKMKDKIQLTNCSLDKINSEIRSLKSQTEKLTKTIKEREIQSKTISEEVEEITQNLAEIKPLIPKLQKDIEDTIRLKNEKSKNNEIMKQQHYKSLSGLGGLNEESKKRKEKHVHRNRQMTELIRSINSRISRIEASKERIKNCEEEIIALNKSLEVINKQRTEFNGQYDQLIVKSNELTEIKNTFRKRVKELRSTIVPLEFQLTQKDNLLDLDQRSIMGAKINLTKEHNTGVEERRATKEVAVSSKLLKTDTKSEKFHLQGQKETFMRLLQEVDNTRTEKVKIETLADIVSEKMVLVDDENESQMTELSVLKTKIEHQSARSEELRDERNASKRKLEELETENSELRTASSELESTVTLLKTKYENMLADTASDHLALRVLQEDIDLINMKMNEMQKMIRSSERFTSRLQAESQTLFHILQDANHDQLQQKKELQLLFKNREIVQGQILKKDKQLKELREKIQSDEHFLKKSSEMFNENTQEIVRMQQEIQRHEKTTKELETKREKIKVLEYEMHRTLTEGIVEKQKCATLIHEFSIQRNVHRWDLLNAVDPNFVKQLKFRCEISSKIDTAHRELLRLVDERNELQKKLVEMQKMTEKMPAKNSVMSDIKRYKEDIKRMDREMAEMEDEMRGNRTIISQKAVVVSTVRNKVVERKDMTETLKNEISDLKERSAENDGTPQAWFMTEVPITKPCIQGGGFSMNMFSNSSTATFDPSMLRRSEPKGDLFICSSSNCTSMPASTNRSRTRSSFSFAPPSHARPIYQNTNKPTREYYGWQKAIPAMS